MADTIGRLLVTLGIDRRAFDRGLRGVQSSVSSLTRSVAGIGAVVGLPVGFALLTRAIVRETVAAEQAQIRVEQAIAATGRAGKIAAADVDQLAKALQRTSTFDDDDIKSAVATLLQFRTIGTDVIPQATQAVVDLAARMGTDLNAAAKTLGLAIAAPEKAAGRLARSQVLLSKETIATSKALREQGRDAEASALVLRDVSTQVDGSAQRMRNSLGGALEALGVAASNLLEQDSLLGLRDEIERLTTALSDPKVQAGIDKTFTTLVRGIESAVDAAKWFAENPKVLGFLTGAAFGSRFGVPGALIGGAVGSELAERATESDRDRAVRELRALQDSKLHAPGGFTPRDEERLAALTLQVREYEEAGNDALEAARAFTLALGESGAAADVTAPKVQKLAGDTAYLDQVLEALRRPVDTTELDRVVGALRKQSDATEDLANRAADAATEADAEVLREYETNAQLKQEALERPFLNAQENIQRAFGDLFTDLVLEGKDAFEDLGETAKQILARSLGEGLSALLTNSLTTGGAGGSGLLGRVLGAGGVAVPGSDETASNIEKNTAKTAANTTGLTAQLTELAGALVQAAAGAAAGVGGAQLTGGNSIGGAVGGLAGSILGSYFGPAGSAAGGLIGGILGGAIPPTTADILHGRNPLAETNRTQRATRSLAIGVALMPILDPIVTAIVSRLVLGTGEGKPSNFQLLTAPAGANAGPLFAGGASARSPFGQVGLSAAGSDRTRNEQVFADAIAAFDVALASRLDPGMIDDVTQALQTTPALAGTNIRVIDNELVAALQDRARLVLKTAFGDRVPASTLDEFLPLSGKNQTPESVLEKFGQLTDLLDGFDRGLRELRGEEFTQAEEKLRGLRTTMGDLVPAATALNVPLEQILAAFEQGKTKIATNINTENERAILAITNPLAAALADFDDVAQRRLAEVRAAGADTILLERRNGLERNKLIKDLLESANGQISALIQQQTASTGSPLAFTESLANATALFESAVSGRRGGDLEADVAGTASALIDLLKTGFSSSESFFQGIGDVPGFFEIIDTLKELKVTVPGGDPAAAAVSGLADQQAREAKRSEDLLQRILTELGRLADEAHKTTTIRPAA